MPLASIYGVGFCIILSTRLTDIRSTQQMSYLTLVPFIILYILLQVRVVSLENETLLLIGVIIAVIDIGLYFISRLLFEREEILTKWK